MNDTLLVVAILTVATLALFALGLLSLLMLPLFLLIVLAIAIFEFIGIRHVRRRFGKLQFPVITLRHKETGNRVRLIGVIHVAEPQYWLTIQKLVDRYKPTAVLYEMVSKPSDAEIARFSDGERETFEFMANHKRFTQNIVQLLGLRYQIDGLPYPSHWVRTDMSGVRFIKLLAENDATHPEETAKKREFFKKMNVKRNALKWILHKALGHIALLSFIGSKIERSPHAARESEIILSMRNEIATEAIARHIGHGDVVSIWGAGHLTGMVPLLAKAGFVEERKDWLTAWAPPKFSFINSLSDEEDSSKN